MKTEPFMPRLTGEQGARRSLFLYKSRTSGSSVCLFGAAYVCVFSEKTEHLAEIGISFVPYYLGTFLQVIGNSLKFPMTQKRSDECIQPTKMWKNKILILGGERSMKGYKS